MYVLIDAGHGIDTPGKRSPDGRFREYMWNRQEADILSQELRLLGIPNDQVVTETNDIPLSTRAARVNRVCREMGKENVILLSVHANAAGMGDKWYTASGWSCYTSPGATPADRLAERLYDSFARAFPEKKMRRDYTDGDQDFEAYFTLLTKTLCPAVILENFFYDNREECRWLMLEDTKIRIARAAARGVLEYMLKR